MDDLASSLAGGMLAGDEGEALTYGETTVKFKIRGQESGGAVCVWQSEAPPGTTVPMHKHLTEDEIIYVVEGELEITLGGTVLLAGPGDMVKMPRGVPHGIRITGSVTARSIWMAVPAGKMESMFRALAALPQDGPIDPEVRARIYLDHDIIPVDGGTAERIVLLSHQYLDQRHIPYERLSFSESTEKGAANVAHALGYRERQMVKTLIFENDKGERALVMLGGDQNAISGHLKKVLGSRNIRLADPADVIDTTGYRIGSIPPFHWQPEGFRSFLEASLMEELVLGVGAGRWGEEIMITPANLVLACAAQVVNLTDRDKPILA